MRSYQLRDKNLWQSLLSLKPHLEASDSSVSAAISYLEDILDYFFKQNFCFSAYWYEFRKSQNEWILPKQTFSFLKPIMFLLMFKKWWQKFSKEWMNFLKIVMDSNI